MKHFVVAALKDNKEIAVVLTNETEKEFKDAIDGLVDWLKEKEEKKKAIEKIKIISLVGILYKKIKKEQGTRRIEKDDTPKEESVEVMEGKGENLGEDKDIIDTILYDVIEMVTNGYRIAIDSLSFLLAIDIERTIEVVRQIHICNKQKGEEIVLFNLPKGIGGEIAEHKIEDIIDIVFRVEAELVNDEVKYKLFVVRFKNNASGISARICRYAIGESNKITVDPYDRVG